MAKSFYLRRSFAVMCMFSLCAIAILADESTRLGVLQCRKKCEHHSGCSAISYVPRQLSCQFNFSDKNQDRAPGDESVILYPQNTIFFKTDRCVKYSKMFRNHKGKTICKEYKKQSVAVAHPRLIVFTSEEHPSYQVYLQNKSLAYYPFPKLKAPVTVIYISKYKIVVVADALPFYQRSPKAACKIRICLLDHSHCVYDSSICVGSKLAVDEERDLLFVPSVFPDTAVKVMTTKGNNLRTLVETPARPDSIAADSQRRMIFVSFPRDPYWKIVQYDYNGHTVNGKLVTNKFIQPWITFDTDANVLYFQLDTAIYTVSIDTGKTKVYRNISFRAKFFDFIGRDLLIQPRKKHDNLTLEKEDGEKEFVELRNLSCTICLIRPMGN